MNSHFSVVVRCKPSAEEKAWRCGTTDLEYAGKDGAHLKLEFDRVFVDGVTHAELYEQSIEPHVGSALQGGNVAVVVYGLPCAGKSHTVFGTSGQIRIKKEARGVIVRCGQQIFDALQKEDHSSSIYRITTTFYHVFEDGRIADLFDTKKRSLDISENPATMTYTVANLTEHVVNSSHEVLRLVEKGYLMRNASGCVREEKGAVKSPPIKPLQQYRQHCSHAIFRFTIEHLSTTPQETSEVAISHITIVDLAGRNIENFHTDVLCSDVGIEALHKVLNTLPEAGYVAASTLFPKSSLTKVLKPCFGGNCRTTIIANVCLNESSAATTRKCLELLQATRRIKNFSKAITIPLSQTKLGRCLKEVESLKAEVGAKLLISSAIHSWERENASSIKINGTTYDNLSTSCQDIVKRIAAVETQLILAGQQPKQVVASPSTKPLGGPLAMLRPSGGSQTSSPRPRPKIKLPNTVGAGKNLTPQKPPSSVSFLLPTQKPTVAQGIQKLEEKEKERGGQARGKEQQVKSNESSSLEEESDSDSEIDFPATPPISGPLPPPLKGIPHIKPNSTPTDETSTPTPIPVPRPLSGAPKPPVQAPAVPSTVTVTVSPTEQARGTLVIAKGKLPTTVHVRQAPSPFPRQPPQGQKQSMLSADLPQKPHPLMSSPTTEQPFPPTPPTSPSLPTPTPPSLPTPTPPSLPTTTPSSHPSPTPSSLPSPTSPSLPSPIPPSLPSPTPPSLLAPATVPVVPVSTSTPRARRTLLPELSTNPAWTVNPAQNIAEVKDLRTHQPPAAPLQPQQEAAPLDTAISASTPSPLTNVQPPRVPLSHIRPLFSHHAAAPTWTSTAGAVTRSQLPEEGSEGEVEASSSDITLSDTDFSDEARDDFDPNIQRRLLPLQPIATRPYPYPTVAGMRQLPPVLPSIGQGPSLSPITSHPHTFPPTNDPPTYEQASFESQGNQGKEEDNPPDYYKETGRVKKEEGDKGGTEGETIDMSQYMSSEDIHVAAMEGVKTATMKKLAIQFGVDYRDHGGRTPLMYTVLGNQPRMCEVLLSLGAAANARDTSGLTPLLWATYQAKPQIIRVLLRHGADVKSCDSNGRTCFHWAVKTPNVQCLKVLCKKASSSVVNKTDKEGLAPLHWAVMCDQATYVRILLTSTPANVHTQDNEGRTPLNYAVLSFSPSCIKAILDCCESTVNLTDSKGRTALHYACAEGSADCVRTLLSYHSCDLHCTDARGTTPLHWAAVANQPGLVQLLLRRGADRAQRDCDNLTPLDHAQQQGYTDCIRILQTYGLRRPMSAISVASQFSLAPATTPLLDEHGHVPLRRPKKQFSLSGTLVSSIDRLPADGQAHSEDSPQEEQPPVPEEQTDAPPTGEGTAHAQKHSVQRIHSRESYQPSVRHRWWLPLLCGSSEGITCCSGRRNIVMPASSAPSLS